MNRRAFWTGIAAWLTGTAAVFVGFVLLAEPSPAERRREECLAEYEYMLDHQHTWDDMLAHQAERDACLAPLDD